MYHLGKRGTHRGNVQNAVLNISICCLGDTFILTEDQGDVDLSNKVGFLTMKFAEMKVIANLHCW